MVSARVPYSRSSSAHAKVRIAEFEDGSQDVSRASQETRSAVIFYIIEASRHYHPVKP